MSKRRTLYPEPEKKDTQVKIILNKGFPIIEKENLMVALRETGGSIAASAKAMGVARSSVARFIKEHPDSEEIRKELVQIREAAVDDVESALYRMAMAGDAQCIIFFLKTRARHRGYGDNPAFGPAGPMVDIIEAEENTGKRLEEGTRKYVVVERETAVSIYDVLARSGALPATIAGPTVDGVYSPVSDTDPDSGTDSSAS